MCSSSLAITWARPVWCWTRLRGNLSKGRRSRRTGGAESDYRPERWNTFREDYRFTGKEEDVEVGLQYFGKRFYAPLLGRWTSADPLAVHDAASAERNLYAYVHGQVLKATDPLGLYTEDNQAYLDSAQSSHETPFQDKAGVDHYYFQAPAGYSGSGPPDGWQGELNDDTLDSLREAGFIPYHYEPNQSLPEASVGTGDIGGHRLTHDEQVTDMIHQYREASSGSTPADEGYGPAYDAWTRAREDYSPVNLGQAEWHGDRSVLRDTEHYMMRYWLSSQLGHSRW